MAVKSIIGFLVTVIALVSAGANEGLSQDEVGRVIAPSPYHDAVSEIYQAVGRGDYGRLLGALSEHTASNLKYDVKSTFGGDAQRLMELLSVCRHPFRFRTTVRIEGIKLTDHAEYRKVILLGGYSTLHGVEPPTVEDKPVALWVGFQKAPDGQLKLHLDYGLHDIIYLLQ